MRMHHSWAKIDLFVPKKTLSGKTINTISIQFLAPLIVKIKKKFPKTNPEIRDSSFLDHLPVTCHFLGQK